MGQPAKVSSLGTFLPSSVTVSQALVSTRGFCLSQVLARYFTAPGVKAEEQQPRLRSLPGWRRPGAGLDTGS